MTKQDIDLAEYVQDSGIKLKWNGKHYFGCCPIHEEKTPSFLVNPSTGKWHCFGCGEGGDVIDLVIKTHHVTYPKALQILGLSTEKPQKDEFRKAEESKAKRKEKQKFEKWKSWYTESLFEQLEMERHACKALTVDNFEEYCGFLYDVSRVEHEIEIMCGYDEDAKKALCLKMSGKAEKPLNYEFYKQIYLLIKKGRG